MLIDYIQFSEKKNKKEQRTETALLRCRLHPTVCTTGELALPCSGNDEFSLNYCGIQHMLTTAVQMLRSLLAETFKQHRFQISSSLTDSSSSFSHHCLIPLYHIKALL